MIVVTGGAGFIGSCFVAKLNQEGIYDILVVDHCGEAEKWMNLRGKKFLDYIERKPTEEITTEIIAKALEVFANLHIQPKNCRYVEGEYL